ncbi:MAG: hypothetical protein LBU32_14455 [Clostridiales bacterium]|jgi:hypothetical protein|nr:hypothetical protein [Clostridiales bacterium]
MRKRHLEQILDLLKTFKESHDEIKRLASCGQMDRVLKMASECVEAACEARKFISLAEGEEAKPSKLFEEFQRLLERIPVQANEINGSTLSVEISKKLLEMEKCLLSELQDCKIEIAFISYKASMWDSFESIWSAAQRDPSCDCHVIPVPYYDRLSGGAFGQLHYEGAEHPSYVPVTDWRTYNIKERRPDVIFINSPYDEGNYVTSIHPSFYSGRLKQFTEFLVYIPYFVCVDDVPEEFCACAGVLNSDRVIVQSDAVRNTYMRVFREFEKECGCEGLFGDAEEKFIALGSPKFDKALIARRQDYELPDSWRKLIEKADGSRKKIILYNTTVSALLKSGEKALNKLRFVFESFKKNQSFVIWWRPHPLNDAACQSMRPHLLGQYLEAVESFKKDGFGIYDDQPDPHRAIALSDAYFGDWSSLAALFQCAGKPVMIQNFDVSFTSEDFRDIAIFANLYDDGDNLWFCAEKFNALFKMDKQSWTPKLMAELPQRGGNPLNRQIVRYEGRLYSAPFWADKIMEYDIEAASANMISFPPFSSGSAKSFSGAIAKGGGIYFIPYYYPAIMRLDPQTRQLSFFSDWLEPLKKLSSDANDAYFLYPLDFGDSFLLAACGANAVVEFNVKTLASAVYELGPKGSQYNGICFDGENCWLTPRHFNPIVKWNPKTGTTKWIDPPSIGGNDDRFAFLPSIYCNGYIWLFPRLPNKVHKIDVRTDELTVAEEFESFETAQEDVRAINGKRYFFFQQISDSIYAYEDKTHKLVEFCFKTNKLREQAPVYHKEDIGSVRTLRAQGFILEAESCQRDSDCYYRESDGGSLLNFMDVIKECSNSIRSESLRKKEIEIFRKNNCNSDGTAGTEILNLCKRHFGLLRS